MINISKITKILSLDTSTSISGWSTFINGKYNISGIINYKNIKDSDVRMNKMCTSLLSLLDNEEPDIVAIEMTVVLRNPAAQRTLTMILGVVYGWCITHNSEFIMLRPTEWRAAISKEKKGRKREELKAWGINKVKELYGVDVTSDDESDAILIGQAFINLRTKGKK